MPRYPGDESSMMGRAIDSGLNPTRRLNSPPSRLHFTSYKLKSDRPGRDDPPSGPRKHRGVLQESKATRRRRSIRHRLRAGSSKGSAIFVFDILEPEVIQYSGHHKTRPRE